jgi:hypothetical protein
MHADCHSLFLAVAASMTRNNEFFVDGDLWVTNSAINALRDAAANYLILQSLHTDDKQRVWYFTEISFAMRT